MICEQCKKHIKRKFLSNGQTKQCLYYACERPYVNPGLIECTRDEICDYIYEIIQPERSKREDSSRITNVRTDPNMLPRMKLDKNMLKDRDAVL